MLCTSTSRLLTRIFSCCTNAANPILAVQSSTSSPRRCSPSAFDSFIKCWFAIGNQFLCSILFHVHTYEKTRGTLSIQEASEQGQPAHQCHHPASNASLDPWAENYDEASSTTGPHVGVRERMRHVCHVPAPHINVAHVERADSHHSMPPACCLLARCPRCRLPSHTASA